MREIEIKLRANNLDAIEQQFKEKGWIFSEPIFQHDVVYSSTTNNEAYDKLEKEGYIAIRIRYQNNKATLTLKKQLSSEMDNLEYESVVENPKDVHEMLLALGWKPEVEVKKTRKKAKMGEYELCLDRVENLGDYLEIEKLTDDNVDPQKVVTELYRILEPFGLSNKDEESMGYDTLMWRFNKNHENKK